jgi:hypothetical protein
MLYGFEGVSEAKRNSSTDAIAPTLMPLLSGGTGSSRVHLIDGIQRRENRLIGNKSEYHDNVNCTKLHGLQGDIHAAFGPFRSSNSCAKISLPWIGI